MKGTELFLDLTLAVLLLPTSTHPLVASNLAVHLNTAGRHLTTCPLLCLQALC
jgi:hypothetical protein